jgi:beta-lactam-binding protein with PASTA domain
MPHGSDVKLTVGYREGKQFTSVPRLMGMHLHQAKTALWQNGLNVNKVIYDESVKDLKSRRLARVYMQTQPAKKGVMRGTKVSLYLTCDETLVDSLSKISDKNQKYLDEQRKLMEQEAQEEARLKEEAEAKRREEEERRNAEAAAALEGKETFDGAVQVYGGEAEAKAVAAAIAAEKEASKADQGADNDIIDE